MENIAIHLKPYMRASVPPLRTGDIVRVHEKIKEGDRQRIQIFEGLIISRKHGDTINGTFAVRKISHGVGVERTFAIHSPLIEKIEIVRHEKVRRSKLYYVRELIGKKAKRRKATTLDQMFTMENAAEEAQAKPEEMIEEVNEAPETAPAEPEISSNETQQDLQASEEPAAPAENIEEAPENEGENKSE